ncbi:hypothetical protein MTY414_73700 [Mycolicibacterium mageritense]|nr:hypothetical protein MTY414_73700 [Mycolicibacterium mageritense]
MPSDTPDLVWSASYTYERSPHRANGEGLNSPNPVPFHRSRATELPPTLKASGDTRNSEMRGRPRLERDHSLDPAGPRGKGRPERANEQAPVGVPRPCGERVIPVTGNDVDRTATVDRHLVALVRKGNSVSPQLGFPTSKHSTGCA